MPPSQQGFGTGQVTPLHAFLHTLRRSIGFLGVSRLEGCCARKVCCGLLFFVFEMMSLLSCCVWNNMCTVHFLQLSLGTVNCTGSTRTHKSHVKKMWRPGNKINGLKSPTDVFEKLQPDEPCSHCSHHWLCSDLVHVIPSITTHRKGMPGCGDLRVGQWTQGFSHSSSVLISLVQLLNTF